MRKTLLVAPLKSHLAERLRDAFRAEILRGRWSWRLPTERSLAQEFQVSRPTVHLALRTLQREGFVHNQRGHPWTLVQRTRAISHEPRRREVVMFRDQQFKHQAMLFTLLTELLIQKLHRIGLGFRAVYLSTHDMRYLSRTLAEFDAENKPSFYLLSSVPPMIHQWFANQKIGALILGSRTDDIALPAIDLDSTATVRHAVQYLIRRKHRRLALLNLPLTTVGAININNTFLKSCKEVSAEGIEGVIKNPRPRPHTIEMAVRRLFARSQPPTAVITTDLELTMGLYTTLGLLGFRIPRDVSIIVCEHWPIMDYLRPLSTCYRLSWQTAATRIVRIISNDLHLGLRTNRFWKLSPTLHEGNSVSLAKAAHV